MPETKNDPGYEQQFLLSALSPSLKQKRFARRAVLVLLVAPLAILPFAHVPLANSAALLPAYATALLLTELITAVLLFAQFSIQRSRALLVLAVGYLFASLMVIPWMLTFPGVFAPTGLLDASLQSTAALGAVRRVGFPMLVTLYALLAVARPAPPAVVQPGRVVVPLSVGAVAVIVCATTWIILANEERMPGFMLNRTQVSGIWWYVSASALIFSAAGILILWRRRHTVLDFWLMVVLGAWFIETLLLGFVSSDRLSLGWWAGRVYGGMAASLVMFMLLAETATLYVRLVRSVLAERRVRETRLMTMEALAASIAHEVNQPLSSMVTNANTGLNWLKRPEPELGEVRAALERVVRDGHRAGQVIESTRMLFRNSAQERVPLNMNAVVSQVLRRVQGEALLNQVTVRTELYEPMPMVTGNDIQLQQVLLNLITNAIDAMSGVADRPRLLRIASGPHEFGSILVSIADSGTGLDVKHSDRIFEPFFTTKPHGIGMGLMLCRSIIESHGGRLWMEAGRLHGAVFHFTLPAEGDDALQEKIR